MRSSLSYDKVNSYPSASSYHLDVLCAAEDRKSVV